VNVKNVIENQNASPIIQSSVCTYPTWFVVEVENGSVQLIQLSIGFSEA